MASFLDTVMATASITNLEAGETADTFEVPGDQDGTWDIYRIATTTAAFLTFNAEVASDGNGEFWPADQVETRKILRGTTVGFAAASGTGRITFSKQA